MCMICWDTSMAATMAFTLRMDASYPSFYRLFQIRVEGPDPHTANSEGILLKSAGRSGPAQSSGSCAGPAGGSFAQCFAGVRQPCALKKWPPQEPAPETPGCWRALPGRADIAAAVAGVRKIPHGDAATGCNSIAKFVSHLHPRRIWPSRREGRISKGVQSGKSSDILTEGLAAGEWRRRRRTYCARIPTAVGCELPRAISPRENR